MQGVALVQGAGVDAHVGQLPKLALLQLEGQRHQRPILGCLQLHRLLPPGCILQPPATARRPRGAPRALLAQSVLSRLVYTLSVCMLLLQHAVFVHRNSMCLRADVEGDAAACAESGVAQ